MTLRPLIRIVCLAILILTFALTVEAQAKAKSQSWLRGTWEGTGYQIDDQSTWTMRFTANGRRFSIEYPSLSCGGKWQLIYLSPSEARFKEKLNHGIEKCANNGTVTIRRISKKQIFFLYSNMGEREISASSVLTKNRKQ